MIEEDKASQITETSIIIQPRFAAVLKSIIQPELKCAGQYRISNVCIDIECQKPAFFCSDQSCNCYEDHLACDRIALAGITFQVKKKERFQRDFFDKIYQTDNQVIDRIKISNQDMAEQISLGSFQEKFMKVLNRIYLRKDCEGFLGKEMHQLTRKLKEKNKDDKARQDQLQKIYNKRAIQLAEEGIRFKRQIFNSFLKNSLMKETVEYKPFIDSPLIRAFLTTLYANNPLFYKNKEKFGPYYIESFDADKKGFDKQYLQFLQAQIHNPTSAQLIFTASQNQFKAAQFHRKCDGVGQTLTVIRTQFGKTIFAYAQQKWSSANANIADPTNRSCIVLLDIKKKCTLTNNASSIHGNTSYGPAFGNYDIQISNDCNSNQSSYGNFPQSYNNGYSASQDSYFAISGQWTGSSFRVVQYEVFKLNF